MCGTFSLEEGPEARSDDEASAPWLIIQRRFDREVKAVSSRVI